MATWVRSGTGTAPSSTNANLSGRYALDTATAPGDFDAAGVTAVQIAYTITGASFVDDSWANLRAATLDDATNTAATINGTDAGSLGNEASTTDETDSSPNTGLTTANWEAMAVSGGTGVNGDYTTWNQQAMPDGGTQTMSALTVTITYTPAAGTDEIAGDAEAAAETTADLTLLIKPTGNPEAAAETTGGLTVVAELVGAVEAAAENPATPTQVHALDAAPEAATEVAGVITQVLLLSGAVESTVEVVATPTQVHSLGCGGSGSGFSSGFSSGFGGGESSCVSAAVSVVGRFSSGRLAGEVEAAVEVDGATLTVTGVTTDFVGWGIPVGVS